jgi:hypothetical protein
VALGLALVWTVPVAAADPVKASVNAPAAARFAGVWMPEQAPLRMLTEDGKEAPLKPEARKLYQQRIALRGAGDTSFDRTTWCAGPGMPRIMFMPYPFEIKPDRSLIAFIHGWYRWHRIVDLSGRPADPILPITMGYPTGRWEGDTLVVRTVGLTSDTILDAAGLPHSEDIVITERIRILPDGRLEDRFTIEDPATFERPWTAAMTYRRVTDVKVGDDVCPDRIRYGEPAVKGAAR